MTKDLGIKTTVFFMIGHPTETIEDIEQSISLIEELDDNPIQEPDKVVQKSEYDIQHHFNRENVNKNVQLLYQKLDESIRKIDEQIFRKYAKTAVTYYSPEKNFVYLRFHKSLMALNLYINQKRVSGVKPITNHENWGIVRVKSENDLQAVLAAIRKSHELMKKAISDNINTGWYAVTPREKMTWVKTPNDDDEGEEQET